jgi:hypothetical protein
MFAEARQPEGIVLALEMIKKDKDADWNMDGLHNILLRSLRDASPRVSESDLKRILTLPEKLP